MSQIFGLGNGAGGGGGGSGGGGGVEGDRGRHRVPDCVLVGLRRRRRRQTAITELEYRRLGRGLVGPTFILRYLGDDRCDSVIFNYLQSFTTELVVVRLVWLPADLFSTFRAS